MIEEAKNDIEIDLLNLKRLQEQEQGGSLFIRGSTSLSTLASNAVLNEQQQQQQAAATTTASSLLIALNQENCKQLEENLNELTLKIDIKKRLINELELNSKNLEQMRIHYQEKMQALSERIRAVEEERDKILGNRSRLNSDNKLDEQIRKIRAE